jgi:chemotaxis protein methyltransferase CheR
MDLDSIKILATDIDDGAIAKAKNGTYVPKSLVNLPKDFVGNYFTKAGENYKISDKIKNRIEIKHHNLLKDKYPDNCDLIVCRNVMIYFTEEAKSIMYQKFREVSLFSITC